MFNPLLGDLSKLKQEDLEVKIMELAKKYHIALRLGQGGAAQQIALNLDAYRSEMEQRRIKALKELDKKNDDNNLGDLINVD